MPAGFVQNSQPQISTSLFPPAHDIAGVPPTPMSMPDKMYGFDQSQSLTTHLPRQMSISSTSPYGSVYDDQSMMDYPQMMHENMRRSYQGEYMPQNITDYHDHSARHAGGMYQLSHLDMSHNQSNHLDGNSVAYQYPGHASSPHGSRASLSPASQQIPQPQHHHHHLPPQRSQQTANGWDVPSSPEETNASSVVGQPGMPDPAARPKGPKLKFTAEDDALLIELKETKNLTWKQIADFFPGRSSGTLQVRYCTKLKAKTTTWTEEAVTKLRTAIQEYEDDRWRAVAAKVGNGMTASACKEKAWDMEAALSMNKREDSDDPESSVAEP